MAWQVREGAASEGNVAVVRRLYQALKTFDPTDSPEALQILHPDAEWHGTIGGLSEGTVARGPDEVVRFLLEDSQEWEELAYEPTEFIDAGDRVVVLQRERRKGRLSGVELETETAAIFTVRDGRILRCEGYMDQEQALQAAGLSRPAPPPAGAPGTSAPPG